MDSFILFAIVHLCQGICTCTLVVSLAQATFNKVVHRFLLLLVHVYPQCT